MAIMTRRFGKRSIVAASGHVWAIANASLNVVRMPIQLCTRGSCKENVTNSLHHTCRGCNILLEVAQALVFLHNHGWIHFDIKVSMQRTSAQLGIFSCCSTLSIDRQGHLLASLSTQL